MNISNDTKILFLSSEMSYILVSMSLHEIKTELFQDLH